MLEKFISTLSNGDKCISYRIQDRKLHYNWKDLEGELKIEIIEDTLERFFTEREKWYPLGASMTEPIEGGLGEFLLENYKLSPRYASLIAAIMVNESLLRFKGKKPIMLKKNI